MSTNELPEGWIHTKLGKVVDYGKATKCNLEDVQPDTWVLELEDIEKGTSKLIQRIEASNRPFKSTKNVFKTGDVLYGKLRPYLNKVLVAETDGVCTTEIVPIDAEPFVNNRYLFYWFRGGQFLNYVEAVSYGVNMPRLGTKEGIDAPLVLAPIAEQQVIADKLDTLLAQVESIKARLERIPEILKQFRQSVLAAAVSGKLTEEWRRNNPTEVVSNDELLSLHKAFWLQEKEREFQQKGKLPSNDKWRSMYKPPELIDIEKCWQTPETWAWVTIDSISFVTKLAGFEFTKSVKYIEDGEISVIKAENVGKDGFRSTNFSKVAKEVVESLPRSELFGDELLVVFVGAGVGQVGLVPSDQKYFLGPNVAVVRKTTGVYTSKFMELMLRSPLGHKNLLSFSKGAAQPSLSMGQIRQTTIPVPPLNEQELIILKLENLFNKANAIETQVLSALDRVNNLTQSILAKAFCGELTAEWREANTELIIGENSAEALLERIKAERELAKPATKRGRGKS
ncbi:restriction endonuclease subunit S [Acinetobacter baumannii]|uniref:restriction endonuclease subunit S n=1 Tax=Acinetobacter baumannii TaxID=470 RepID=UPI001EEB29A8|nr:restriction endonuclease subunit S [Acinetobacter baumannii]HAV5510517.1 restriction endonuclease subunit S [Acinetobacter baumannii]